jgi:hypothetical protein
MRGDFKLEQFKFMDAETASESKVTGRKPVRKPLYLVEFVDGNRKPPKMALYRQ